MCVCIYMCIYIRYFAPLLFSTCLCLCLILPGRMLGCFLPDFLEVFWSFRHRSACISCSVSTPCPVSPIIRHRLTHVPFLTFHLAMSFPKHLPSLFPTHAYGFIFTQWPHLPLLQNHLRKANVNLV